MQLIKDLGTRRTGNRMTRYGLYKCSICHKTKEKQTKKSGEDSLMCRSCRSRETATKHGFTNKSSSDYNIYTQWQAMNRRCVTGDSVVSSEWNDPKLFIKWARENGWKKGLHLDKDIICERDGIYPKVYSPRTCMFITGSKNSSESSTRNNPINKIISVVQMTLDGEEIRDFNSAKEAESTVGTLRCSIGKCCKGKQITAGGFKWKYKS